MTVKKGRLAAMKVVNEGDELMIISEEGIVVRTPAKGVSQLGRAATQGVRIMDIAPKDGVTAVATLPTKARGRRTAMRWRNPKPWSRRLPARRSPRP